MLKELIDQQHQTLLAEQSRLKTDALIKPLTELMAAEAQLERAKIRHNEANNVATAIVQQFQQKIYAYNRARLQLFLKLQTDAGLVWDSYVRRFLPKECEEIFYSLSLRIGARISEDDCEETWQLNQTPSREKRDKQCWARPWEGFELPVTISIVTVHLKVTEPDSRWEGWKENVSAFLYGPQTRRSLSDREIIWMLPSEVPEDLAKKYGLPPALEIPSLKDFRLVAV